MIHALVDYQDSILRTPMEKFDFSNPPTDPIQLSRDLAESLIINNGLGLSANQIGLPYTVFAMMAEKIIVCFNPRIVDTSQETILLEEGCLTYPGLFVKIKRPRRIKVRYDEPSGETVTKTFSDLTSRIWQIQYSFNLGNYVKDMPKLKREKLLRYKSKS